MEPFLRFPDIVGCCRIYQKWPRHRFSLLDLHLLLRNSADVPPLTTHWHHHLLKALLPTYLPTLYYPRILFQIPKFTCMYSIREVAVVLPIIISSAAICKRLKLGAHRFRLQ